MKQTKMFQHWQIKIWPGKRGPIHYATLQNVAPYVANSPFNSVPESEIDRFGAWALTLLGQVGCRDKALFDEMKKVAQEVYGIRARILDFDLTHRFGLTVIGGDLEGVVKLWHYDGFNRRLTQRIMDQGLCC